MAACLGPLASIGHSGGQAGWGQGWLWAQRAPSLRGWTPLGATGARAICDREISAHQALRPATMAELEFQRAVEELDQFQDDMEWANVKPKWKSTAARWSRQLRSSKMPSGACWPRAPAPARPRPRGPSFACYCRSLLTPARARLASHPAPAPARVLQRARCSGIWSPNGRT